MECGERSLGKPWLSRKPVLILRPSPQDSLALRQGVGGRGGIQSSGAERGREREGARGQGGTERRQLASSGGGAAARQAGGSAGLPPQQQEPQGLCIQCSRWGKVWGTAGSPEACGDLGLCLLVTYMAMNISPSGTSQNPRQTPLTEAGSMSPKRWKFSISGLCPSTASCLFLSLLGSLVGG